MAGPSGPARRSKRKCESYAMSARPSGRSLMRPIYRSRRVDHHWPDGDHGDGVARRARGEAWPISGSVFGASTKNRSSLEASLGFAAITGTPRIENGATFAVDFADGRRDRHNLYVRPDAPQRLAYTAGHPAPLNPYVPEQRYRLLGHRTTGWLRPQDYSGFGLKAQTATPKSAQLASRARARGIVPGRSNGAES